MKRPIAAIAALSFAGMLDSGYLLYIKIQLSQHGLGCSFGGCDIVNQSAYATLMGVPVALWGFISYALLLGLALLLFDAKGTMQRGLHVGIVLLSGWGVAFSAYLTAVEIFILDSICPFCVVSAIIVSAIFVIALISFVASKSASPAR